MIADTLFTLLMVLSGAAVLATLSSPRLVFVPLSYLFGIASYTATTYLLIFMRVYPGPLITSLLVVGASIAYWLSKHDWHINLLLGVFRRKFTSAIVFAGGVVAFSGLMQLLNATKYTFDTAGYLMTGTLIHRGSFSFLAEPTIQSLFSPTAVIHAFANEFGEDYLIAFGPITTLALIIVFLWLAHASLSELKAVKQPRILATAAAAAMVTGHGFIWNAFYLNSHALFAATLLTFCGLCWLAQINRSRYSQPFYYAICVVMAGYLVLLRTEGIFVAGLAAVPIIFSTSATIALRQALLAGISVALILDHATKATLSLEAGLPLDKRQILMMSVGALGVITVIAWRRISVLATLLDTVKRPGIIIFLVLAAFLTLLTIRDPTIFKTSLKGTLFNTVTNPETWGASLLILGILVLLVSTLKDVKYSGGFLTLLYGFVPTMFVLAYLRGGAFRENPADSLNRMFMHIVPVAFLYLVIAAGSKNRRVAYILARIFQKIHPDS